MAANKYEIVIKNETQSKNRSPIASNSQDEQAKKTKKQRQKENRENLAGYFAFKRIIAPFVGMGIEYGISTVSVRTGRAEAQQRIQVAYSVCKQIVGTVENIAIGAAVGGLAGAIGGAVMSVATTVAGFAINQGKINIQRNLENISLGLMNIRAGGNVAATSNSR